MRAFGRVGAALETAPVAAVVGGLIVVEWLAVLALALTVRHNGWIYYQGGDQLWYFTLGRQLAEGQLWQTPVGYLWSFVLAPFAAIGGPSLVAAMPAIVLFNVLVLLPLTMLLVFGIASRVAGRAFGYWALVTWIAVPFAGILYTNAGYHQRYTELLLPQGFGLTAMADFPTMVAATAMLYFAARVLTSEASSLLAAAACGVAGGMAVATKPSAAPLLFGPVLAFALARRLDAVRLFGLALAPFLFALLIWKERGLGSIPVVGQPGDGVAAGAPLGALNLDRYFGNLSWDRLGLNIDLLREHFWSGHLVIWLFLAGLVAVGRRSWSLLALVAGGTLPFVLIKGSYPQASFEDGSLFRLLMPVFPVFVLGLASLPFLLPGVARRLDGVRAPAWQVSPRTGLAALGVALVLSVVAPAVVMAAASTDASGAQAANVAGTEMPVPIDVDLDLRAETAGRTVQLEWDDASFAGSDVIYRIWRYGNGDGVTCADGPGAARCTIAARDVGTTREPVFQETVPPGRWTYRIAVMANWLDDPAYGDVYFTTTPLAVTLP